MFKHFNWRSFRDHWNSEMCEWAYEQPGMPITMREKWITFKSVLRIRLLATWCDLRGHDYQPDGRVFVESGGEGLECRRCGFSKTIWF